MNDGVKYNNGEVVVNKNTFRQGIVVDIQEDNSGNIEKIHVQYEDGFMEWNSPETICKLLL